MKTRAKVIVIVLLVFIPISILAQPYEGEKGDVDNDGTINVLDALITINHILGFLILSGDSLWRADCNCDGLINVLDVVGIINVILGVGECQPSYCVSGTVLNSATNQPVSGAYVLIDDKQTETDSLGSYSVSQVIGGRSHTIAVHKDYFETFSTEFILGYGDLDSLDITLGKIYYHVDMFNPGEWRGFSTQGMAWIGSNLWSADSISHKIYAHNYDSYLSIAQTYKLPNYTTPKGQFFIAPLGLEFHRNYLVTYDDQRNTIYELILTAGDTALIQNEFELPDEVSSIGDLWDFTFDGSWLWSTCAGSYNNFHRLPVNNADDVIYQHNVNLTIRNAYPVMNINDEIVNPTGIAWDGEIFWLNSRGNHRLYMLDEQLNVLGYYVFDETIWLWAPYQICWGNGYLWGCYRDSWEGIN